MQFKELNEFSTIDVAVNNAGVEGVFAPIHLQLQKNYEHVFNINVLGVFLCIKHQIPIVRLGARNEVAKAI